MKSVMFHVTDLDSYAWYLKLDSMTDKDMRNRILRLEPANEKMRIGTAWHTIMEEMIPSSKYAIAGKDGCIFNIECDCEIILPQICEVMARKIYQVDGHNITLSGKADGISGNKIIDHKLTFNPKPEYYFDAYQWKAYLDIFNADCFEYIIYSAKQKNAEITIYDVSKTTMYRYPGMVQDIEKGIRDLLGFVKIYVPEMIK